MDMEKYIEKILQKNSYMADVFADILRSENFKKLLDEVTETKDYNELPDFVFSGVGKNWYICEKVTKVFLSLGLHAQALDCVHAIHGDLGMFTGNRKKVLFFVSKSGTSDELVKLAKVIKYLKEQGHIKNLKVVGLFLNTNQEKNKDLFDLIITPSSKYDGALYPEFDERDIIPSLTINTMQSILDLFGAMVYERYPELVERYKYNHLAGANGARLGVSDILKNL